jgi:cyclopropane fatty-acyl-phospholipid synthase-like methyltransferase
VGRTHCLALLVVPVHHDPVGSEIDPRPIVEAGYDAVADRYAALELPQREWPRMRWLAEMLRRIQPGAWVLDVGCGNGVPATKEIARRHEAVGIDISAAQVERARRNVPDAEFIHGDLTEAELPHVFAAIAAFYVIQHLPRERHAATFNRFHDWLAPGGYLLFTIEPEEEPGKVGDWLGRPMFFSQHDAETTLGLVRDAGFEIVRSEIEDQVEGDRELAWLWVLARRS